MDPTRLKFLETQKGKTLIHANLNQEEEMTRRRGKHSFVVCADTQLGMTNANKEWETELAYARQAVAHINSIEPRPAFCCCCGDLVDMEHTFYVDKGFSKEECDDIQDQQNRDFQEVWSKLHKDVAMVCLCGNHDVGNTPSKASILRFNNAFGDDYLAFWVNGTYNIVLNTCLFSNPDNAVELYEAQLQWLKERLEYARRNAAANIFVFGHHPWFLYNDNEEKGDLGGISPFPVEWNMGNNGGFPDWYFHIPNKYRKEVMALFKQHNVDAAFSGHFHQNLVSKASFGMDMIITSSLSMVFQSTGKPKESSEPNTRGIRVVEVNVGGTGRGKFKHWFESLDERE